MSNSSLQTSSISSSSRGSKPAIEKIEITPYKSQKSSRIPSEAVTSESFNITKVQIKENTGVTKAVPATKERASLSPKKRLKLNDSGMDILSSKEMIKFEHANIQMFEPS